MRLEDVAGSLVGLELEKGLMLLRNVQRFLPWLGDFDSNGSGIEDTFFRVSGSAVYFS